MTLEERVKQLKNIRAQLPGTVAGIAKGATLRAIETATELTPPTQDDLRGTNTRSGEMKQRWKKDSRVDPIGAALSAGKECITVLANDMEYASYVNDGHRMDIEWTGILFQACMLILLPDLWSMMLIMQRVAVDLWWEQKPAMSQAFTW